MTTVDIDKNNLLFETGKIVSVDKNCLWVETIQKSTCGGCSARSACGQSVLASLVEQSSYLKVLLEKHQPEEFHIGQIVKIAIPANSVAKGALLVYLLPLVGLLAGAGLGAYWFNSDGFVVLLAGLGFIAGGTLVYILSRKISQDVRYQPFVADDLQRDCIQTEQVG